MTGMIVRIFPKKKKNVSGYCRKFRSKMLGDSNRGGGNSFLEKLLQGIFLPKNSVADSEIYFFYWALGKIKTGAKRGRLFEGVLIAI